MSQMESPIMNGTQSISRNPVGPDLVGRSASDLLVRGGSDPELARRLPSRAAAQVTTGADMNLGSGPCVSDCLYWLYHVKQLVHLAEALHDRVAGVSVHDVRALALPLFQACGAGVRFGAELLAETVQNAAPYPSARVRPNLQSARIDVSAWAYVVCCVRAEAAVCVERAAAVAVSIPWLESDLTELAKRCDEVFRQMAATESFAAWCSTVDPLYGAWLTGSLARASAPPPYFPDRASLYRARPALAANANLEDDWDSPSGGLPVGSLERYVADARGELWAIVLAAPGHVDDPRDWPEPSGVVIAASTSQRGTGTRCYLLAEDIAPRRALECISRHEGGDRLEHVAASVADRALPISQGPGEGWGPDALAPVRPVGLPLEQSPFAAPVAQGYPGRATG